MRTMLARLTRACRRPVLRRADRAYVSGPGLADVLAISREVADRGVAGTLCFWNRAGDSPEATAEAYGAALHPQSRGR